MVRDVHAQPTPPPAPETQYACRREDRMQRTGGVVLRQTRILALALLALAPACDDESRPGGDAGVRDAGTPDASAQVDAVDPSDVPADLPAGEVGPTSEVVPGPPDVVCTRRIHGPGRQLVLAVATAPDGRIAVSGSLIGSETVDFGAGSVPGAADGGFVAVYDAACNVLWSKVVGLVVSITRAGAPLVAVAFDRAGNLYVAGNNRHTIDFGGGPLATKGDYDVVVAKFDASYRLVYGKEFGDVAYQRVDGMGVDPAGNVYLGGTFVGTLDFGGPSPLVAPSSPFRTAVYLAKLDPAGAHVFSKVFPMPNPGSFPSAGDFQMGTLDVGASGDLVLSGVAPNGGSIDFGGGPIMTSASFQYYRWAARLTTAGAHLWSKAFPVFGVLTGSMRNGDIVLAANLHVDTELGPMDASVDFGQGLISGNAALARLGAADGAGIWSKSFPLTVRAVGTSTGGMTLTGSFTSTVDLGCGPLTSAGALDLVLARLSSNGDCLYAIRFGDAKHQFLGSSAVTGSGAVVLGGSYHGTITIGTTTLPNDDTTVTSDPQGDTEDAFVAVFSK
jgi:hypothetical protein